MTSEHQPRTVHRPSQASDLREIADRCSEPAHPRCSLTRNQILAAMVLATTSLVGPAARGQLLDGNTGFQAYEIQYNNQAIGKVVVVHANPPSGYAAETEYWTWTAGQAWRGAFKLVPTDTVPNHAAYTWQTFPHDHFDLSGTVSIPSIDPDPNDAFYKVSVKSGTSWLDRGYLWLVDGSPDVQEWYGKNLTADTIGEGSDIRFESVEPPSAGSENVYLLD